MSGVQYLTGICKHAGSLCLRANDHHHFGDVDTVSQYLVNYSFYRNSMQPPKNFDLVMCTKIPKKFNRNYHSNIFFLIATHRNTNALTQYSIVAVYHRSKSPQKLYLSIYCKFLSRKTMFCSVITSTAM
jgi:arginine/lysine/ornithine decarboxylase